MGEIVDPTRWPASLHDDKIGRIGLEDFHEIITIGSGIDELMFASFCVKVAAHGIEFTEVQSENFHDYESMGCGGGAIVTVAVLAAHNHGLESPDFIRMAPTPKPRTYMDSFVIRKKIRPVRLKWEKPESYLCVLLGEGQFEIYL